MVLEIVFPWNCFEVVVLAILRIVPSAESKDQESGFPGWTFMALFLVFDPPPMPL